MMAAVKPQADSDRPNSEYLSPSMSKNTNNFVNLPSNLPSDYASPLGLIDKKDT